MIRLALAALALSAPAFAQEAPVPPVPPAAPAAPEAPAAPKPKTTFAALETSAGRIVVELEIERAPLTAANFLRYVDQKRFDGTVFYRAMNVAPGFGLIQGGTRNNPKLILKGVPHEPTTKTGLSNTDGAISMARGAPGTANGDFFIVVGNLSSLDADPSKPGDNQGFAPFGRVVEGMDVVKKILAMPATGGEGVMKGQLLNAPVKITAAKRVKAPTPTSAAPNISPGTS